MIVTIYQIKDSKFENCGYSFMSWDFAKDRFNFDDYEEVYSFINYKPLNKENGYSTLLSEDDINDCLNKTFEMLNLNRPEDFKGHSLSISDLVGIDDRLYYCDSFGWERIR